VQPTVDEAPVSQSKIYHTGGYIRLSVEDSGNPGADTIHAQRELVLKYIESQPDMTCCDIYCDNGRTGTNFERPEFERLMSDIREGKIDCIVVKDLSRFGRNYLETGNYLERIFPFLNVRFVAVNDNFDTLTAERNAEGYIVPLKNIFNGAYSRDISRKSGSALAMKQRNGEFIGSWAPYGYQKSAADSHKLEPNPETAPIVQMIFQWRATGISYLKIARKLNEMGIPSPSRYHYQRGEVKAERFANAVWHVPVIKVILSSEVYLGHMVQGRSYNVLSEGKKMCKRPKSEWIVVPNTHEPLIDEDTFSVVRGIAERCRAVHQERVGRFNDLGTVPHILRGLVFCADCKRPMIRYKNVSEGCGHLYYSYICLTHSEDPSSCPKKYLRETKMLEILWDTLRREIALAGKMKKLAAEYNQSAKAVSREEELNRETTAANDALERARMLYDSLYQNYVDHLMSEDEYMELRNRYKQDIKNAEVRLAALEQQKQSELRKTGENPWVVTCERYECETELTEEMAHALIERVEIDADNRVSVALRFRDEYHALVHLLTRNEGVPA
jgi:DNA invertase Pin-like site-specific DNA recombinase